MSLSDELAKEKPRVRCRTCLFYADLDEDERRDFDAWIAEDNSLHGLLRACKRRGLEVGWGAFHIHVREHHGTR